VREEGGERDGFTWVRGRTPSLDDPYVWFDPINPERTEAVASGPVASTNASGADERPENDAGGERGPRSRRRRGRGRGRDRGAEQGLTHEVKVETRATNEGMPTDDSPDTPMAVVIEESTEVAPVALAPEPKRRRVRRKVSTADAVGEAVLDVTPDEAEPAVLDVTPEEAAAELEALPEPMVAAVAEPKPAPQPEVDVAALIAEDPNQIVAPPEKPKRGWWRR
jgi:ribonuclease E